MSPADLEGVVERALAEDMGSGDATSAAVVPEDLRARAEVAQKAAGVLFGLDAAELAFRRLDPEVEVRRPAPEGRWREPGPALELEGRAREAIHQVNTMRKDEGLEITDRIVLTLPAELREHEDWIARETLAEQVEHGDELRIAKA